ncbi:hypothetical protein, conserved [Plasmodium vivax]|uniref:VIR protein n=1 Tax=Plasmodium vivax TaxID=5855 RepID=A0A1G4E3T2_PLAVI|nr:hypothetical protein PVPAM_000024600 [Plasmodium vivax]SCA81803.1 hypothetical protein, conserved [Plasmodium vivax]
MSEEKKFTLDKIKDNHSFMINSKLYKIYKVLDKKCNEYREDNSETCYKEETSGKMVASSDVTELLKKLYSNLKRIYLTLPGYNNTYFDYKETIDYKLYYASLKYWLYDQIVIEGLEGINIDDIFTGWKKNIKNNITYNKNPCVFNKLTLDQIKRLKNIYALYTVLYDNNANFDPCENNTCNYLEYFGKGLDEIISSIDICSSKESKDNYCKEFDEFINMCKDESLDGGIIIYEESRKNVVDLAGKYLLLSEKYNDIPHYIYLKDEKMLNYFKTSDFLSNKTTTIAATSVVGSAIGLPSIFYYFYKFTPFGSTLRKGKGKNVVDIDERANDSLLYTPDIEQIPFKNREYKVAYHTFSDAKL